MHELRPHILLEVMGYLPGHQLRLLARRCTRAPVQVSWLRAFHGSMRADFIDHAVVDSRAVPPTSTSEYTERLTFLPHQHLVASHAGAYATHLRTVSTSPIQADARGGRGGESAWPRRRPIACSLNRINKLEPGTLDVWAGALSRAGAPLWIATGAGRRSRGGTKEVRRALGDEVAARGVMRRAVLNASRAPSPTSYLQRVRRCALALDVRRWGAHTTALDALWVGVGMLHAPGATIASRASHSISHAIAVPELSAASLRSYADLAVFLLHTTPPTRRIDRLSLGQQAGGRQVERRRSVTTPLLAAPSYTGEGRKWLHL